jgi:hypothetical protein
MFRFEAIIIHICFSTKSRITFLVESGSESRVHLLPCVCSGCNSVKFSIENNFLSNWVDIKGWQL